MPAGVYCYARTSNKYYIHDAPDTLPAPISISMEEWLKKLHWTEERNFKTAITKALDPYQFHP